jgi:hypothetical protein
LRKAGLFFNILLSTVFSFTMIIAAKNKNCVLKTGGLRKLRSGAKIKSEIELPKSEIR